MESSEATAVMSRPSSTARERPATGGTASEDYLSSRNSPTRATSSKDKVKLLEFVESMQDFAKDETDYMAKVERLRLGWRSRMSSVNPERQEVSRSVEALRSSSSIDTPTSAPASPNTPANENPPMERAASFEQPDFDVVEDDHRDEEECEREETTSPTRLEITLTPRSIEPRVEDNEVEEESEMGHHQEQQQQQQGHVEDQVEGGEEMEEEMMTMEEVRRVESLSSVKTRARSKRRRTNGPSKARRKSSSVRPVLHQQQDNSQQQQQQQHVAQIAKAKRKKLHGRLRNSNSKSTVTTRDTSFSETRRTERKRPKRHKSLDTISVFRGSQSRKRASGSSLRARESKQITSKDVYELYQNSASKGESGLLQASTIDNSRLSGGASATIAARSSPRSASAAMGYRARRAARAAAKALHEDNRAPERHEDVVVELHRGREADEEISRHGQSSIGVGAPAERFEEGDSVEIIDESMEPTDCCEMHDDEVCENHHREVDDYEAGQNAEEAGDMACPVKKYDRPTESSRMKQVQRVPYRFHVSHIPFVVGTSLSPSHNLGLNIQQVLSLIKVKQPAIPSISPMLIRKVSKGIRPLSSLFEYINGQYGARPSRCSVNFPMGSEGEHQVRSSSLDVRRAFSSFSCSDQTRATPKSVPSATNQSTFKQNLQNISCEPLYEEDEESVYSDAQTGLQGASQVKSLETSSKWESRSFVSHCQSRDSHRPKVQGTGDTQETAPQPSDDPENHEQFLEVFSRLHEQYGRMIVKLDKIKDQLESRRNDKLLQKEAAEMQDAVNAKGQEVEAMIKLYKEVMSLKQQMRQLHQRNSFVCIATDDGVASRPFYSDSRQDWSQSRNRSINEAPNALRLAGLLKQIQAFQRQLAQV